MRKTKKILLTDLGGSGVPIAWSPSRDSAAIAYYDGRDLANGSVASWTSRASKGGTALQPTAGSQAVAASGVVTFDGVDDRLIQFLYPMINNQSFVSTVAVPDGAGNDGVGTGFTNTGLAAVGDGTYWIGNHGRPTLASGATWAPSLVHVSIDFTNPAAPIMVKLGEILLAPLYANIQSVQGVAYDSSDGTIWFADIFNVKIRHITTAGVVVPGDEITYPNSTSDKFYKIAAATGVASKTWSYTEQDQPDHCWYDPTNNLIWFSYGFDNVPGYLTAFNLDTNSVVASYSIPQADAIEGFFIDIANNRLVLCNDAHYHGGSPPTNAIQTYTLPYPTAPFGKTDIVDMMFVGKFASGPASTKAILVLGNPTLVTPGTPATQVGGIGLYGTTTTNVRVIATTQDGTNSHQVAANFTSPSIASDRIIYARIDTTANLISLWVDGTAITAIAASTLDDGRLGLFNAINMGGATGFFGNVAGKAFGYTFGAGDRQRWEGYAAWAFGLTANLPSNHPYKNAAP